MTVIFGAGASYDSIPHIGGRHDFRPPLANELFANRTLFSDALAMWPRILPVVPRLRHLGGANVETVLRELQNEGSHNPVRLQQLMAVRYYLQCMLWECELKWKRESKGVTNYKSLLDEIVNCRKTKDPVCLITFNYDTLLEDAIASVGPAITTLEQYAFGNPEFRLFKLHGSINWARALKVNGRYQNLNAWEVARQHIENAGELQIGDDYLRFETRPCGVTETGVPMVPAIAIPVEQKNHFECPQDHLRELEKLLPETDRLLLIGWRATEDHFLNLLHKHVTHARLGMAVAGSETEALQAIGRVTAALAGEGFHWEALPAGFTNLIVNRSAQAILSA